MRIVATGFAVVALLFLVAGCPMGQNVSELKVQVEEQQQKITEFEGQVQTLTAERDSLQQLVDELSAEKGGPGEKPGEKPGEPKPKPGKPPRTGR